MVRVREELAVDDPERVLKLGILPRSPPWAFGYGVDREQHVFRRGKLDVEMHAAQRPPAVEPAGMAVQQIVGVGISSNNQPGVGSCALQQFVCLTIAVEQWLRAADGDRHGSEAAATRTPADGSCSAANGHAEALGGGQVPCRRSASSRTTSSSP